MDRTFVSRGHTVKNLYWALLLTLALSGFSNAFGSNILIIEPLSGQNGKSIKAELDGILVKNGIKGHKVAVTGPSERDQTQLSGWVHDPGHDAELRWRDLRGEAGTAWGFTISPKK